MALARLGLPIFPLPSFNGSFHQSVRESLGIQRSLEFDEPVDFCFVKSAFYTKILTQGCG